MNSPPARLALSRRGTSPPWSKSLTPVPVVPVVESAIDPVGAGPAELMPRTSAQFVVG
jgi:hypothetical protein